MALAKIARPQATEEVYEALRQAIVSLVFRPGERLHIPEIAAKLGVSSTPVRQAIQKLAMEGLIDIHPRSGTYVATLTAKDIEDTFEIRGALECLAAERAVERMTDADLKRIREIRDAMSEEIVDEASLLKHQRNNAEFHSTLVRASGNRRLQELHESLKANIQIARVHLAEGYNGVPWDVERREHDEILEALEARDAERLKKALSAHIHRAKDSLITGLKSSGKEA